MKMSKLWKNLVLLVAFLSTFGVSVHAGYVQVRPPPGYSFSTAGKPATFKSGPSSNDSLYKGTTVLTNGALDVGGQLVTVPVALRIAANAGTFAAAYSFGNPALFAAVATVAGGALLYDYFKNKDLTVVEGQWNKKFTQTICDGPCTLYQVAEGQYGQQTSVSAAGNNYAAARSNIYAQFRFGSCGANNGGYISCILKLDGSPNFAEQFTIRVQQKPGVTTTSNRPANLTDFETAIAQEPLPVGWPKGLPGFDVPVEGPVAWPQEIPSTNPTPLGQPAPDVAPRWVPTGDPVKNPNDDPANKPDSWTQPGVKVKPSPTPDDPLRVDVTPDSRTKADPSPTPADAKNQTKPDPAADPKPQSLCEQFPDILACSKLGTAPAPTPVSNTNKSMTITKESGFGPENGSCPAPRVLSLHFVTVTMPWDLMCTFAAGIRPFVLGLAYLGAVFTFLGIGRKD